MIRRPGLWLKFLLVALLNVFVLAAVFLIVARVEFRFDLGSFLLGPARARMVEISHAASESLENLPRDRWDNLLAQYSSTFPADFFLFDRTGNQLAGKPVQPPAAILTEHGPPRPPDEDRRPRPPRPDPLAFHRGPRPELPFMFDFDHTDNPAYYWAAVHVLIGGPPGQHPMEARLVWRFESLWSNSFFFDYKPWLFTAFLTVVVSVACWLPLIRSINKTISDLTAATGRIAEGHFEAPLRVTRRDELGRLSESINQMAERLSGFVNGQRRFLGDIAHELCSPVARIQMSLGILEQRASDADRRYVETIDEEVQHMSTLVNELLSFSKASIGASAAMQSVNISESVQRALERERTDAVTINVDVPASLEATAQPDYVFRSISNVLRNAVRYAGSDGPIQISARQLGSFAIISVADQGPGVEEAELNEILKPFYRPETSRQRETGGVGLGLAIVRTCMEACGGTVTCRNLAPKGFQVDLRLPIAGAAPL
jgi:two-component system sensor histidine kinase CpxA